MVVGALCVRDNKILMAKRNIHPRKGYWTLPAGFMENAETVKVGALRETFEETGSEAKVKMPYTMFSLPHINQIHFSILQIYSMRITVLRQKVLRSNYLMNQKYHGMNLHFQLLRELWNIIFKTKKIITSALEKKILLSGNHEPSLNNLAFINICIQGEKSFQVSGFQEN